MRIVNLCHFRLVLGGVTFDAPKNPVKFTPLTKGDGPIKTLVGYELPSTVTQIDDDVEGVVVPRFAPAVAWAEAQGLTALTVPQKHLGQRGAPGPDQVVLDSIDDLEEAPTFLGFDFVGDELPCDFSAGEIQRMVQGTWDIRASGVGVFPPVEATATAYDKEDGTAYIPPVQEGIRAIIVPQSGPCIHAAQEAYTGIAILVTGVVDPGTKEVSLYRVA